MESSRTLLSAVVIACTFAQELRNTGTLAQHLKSGQEVVQKL